MKKLNDQGHLFYSEGKDVFKKPIAISIGEPLLEETLVHTLEGDVRAPIGYRIVTGVKGEQYPISPDVFSQYNQVGQGMYSKQKVMVKAIQLTETSLVDTPWVQHCKVIKVIS